MLSQAWKASGILLMRHESEVTMTLTVIVNSVIKLDFSDLSFSVKVLHDVMTRKVMGDYPRVTYCCCQVSLSGSRSNLLDTQRPTTECKQILKDWLKGRNRTLTMASPHTMYFPIGSSVK